MSEAGRILAQAGQDVSSTILRSQENAIDQAIRSEQLRIADERNAIDIQQTLNQRDFQLGQLANEALRIGNISDRLSFDITKFNLALPTPSERVDIQREKVAKQEDVRIDRASGALSFLKQRTEFEGDVQATELLTKTTSELKAGPMRDAINADILAGNFAGATSKIFSIVNATGKDALPFPQLIEASRATRLALEGLRGADISEEEQKFFDEASIALTRKIFDMIPNLRGSDRDLALQTILDDVIKENPGFTDSQAKAETKRRAIEGGMKFPGTGKK